MKCLSPARLFAALGLALCVPTFAWAQQNASAPRLTGTPQTTARTRANNQAKSSRNAAPLSVVLFETPGNTHIALLSLTFNGKSQALFILDPATTNCIIDQNFVKSGGFAIQKMKVEGNTTVAVTAPDNVVLKGPRPMRMTKVPFIVQDLAQLRRRKGAGAEVVGILGANFLGAFVERIDFSKKQIEFYPKGAHPLADIQAHRLPLQETAGVYSVSATVDGRPAQFIVDLTYQTTALQDAALLSSLKPVARLKELSQSKVEKQTLRLQSLSVGENRWSRPIVEHFEVPEARDNILGADFFARFYVTLDLGGKQMFLQPDPNYKDDVAKWLATGFVARPASDGKLHVASITVPSPASDAGLKPGDEILAINGLPTATTPMAVIFKSTKRFEGAVVTIKIQRQGEKQPRQFALKMRKLL
jgi:hypothetical protein